MTDDASRLASRPLAGIAPATAGPSVHLRFRLIPHGRRRWRDESAANVPPHQWDALAERVAAFVERVRNSRLGRAETVRGARVEVDECLEDTFVGDDWRPLAKYRVDVDENDHVALAPMNARRGRKRL